MTLKYLKDYCLEKIKEYPNLENEIKDFFYWAQSEIEEGGSETHEVELAIQDIDYLIKEQ